MTSNTKYIVLNEENFSDEVLRSPVPVLVDFWAEWCAPCRAAAPAIEALAAEYEGRAKVGKLEIDQNRSIVEKYRIHSVPTLLFFKDGKVAGRLIGLVPENVIAYRLDELLDGEPMSSD